MCTASTAPLPPSLPCIPPPLLRASCLQVPDEREEEIMMQAIIKEVHLTEAMIKETKKNGWVCTTVAGYAVERQKLVAYRAKLASDHDR